ncbi:temptin-like [Ruditapes philippinarum]|uniref:temptin-like n=1 Tax=Ruditapes philippinarum TaxID=129788 RepID=UPI00295B5A8E|nr:temptin-like [Ruditapes philippinarum]
MYRLAVISLVLASASAHVTYQTMIPNGDKVPDPCGNGVWLAVGHYDPLHHTHDKNRFGLDFAAAGHKWTVALCQKDSDNDGKSNGEELGDPTCVWTMGATPTRSASSHPGICNPVGSCIGQSFTCGCHGHNCVGK